MNRAKKLNKGIQTVEVSEKEPEATLALPILAEKEIQEHKKEEVNVLPLPAANTIRKVKKATPKMKRDDHPKVGNASKQT